MGSEPSGRSTWRDLDAASREREYSPSSCIGGNYQPFLQAYADRSQAARAIAGARLDLAYGPQATQRLDLFLPTFTPAHGAAHAAKPKPPLLVFIHGGYWQELSKEDSAFAAADCLAQGMAFAAVGYTLAPKATVAAMVDECRAALAWLRARADTLGFDAHRIVVAGSSAGAHLAAMTALSTPTHQPAVHAAVLVSGLYELEPLIGTSINTALGLTVESARAVSPALLPLAGFVPSIVCWGAVETLEFKRQSQAFAASLADAGSACQVFEVPSRNHFDVVLDLADPGTDLGRAVAALVQSL